MSWGGFDRGRGRMRAPRSRLGPGPSRFSGVRPRRSRWCDLQGVPAVSAVAGTSRISRNVRPLRGRYGRRAPSSAFSFRAPTQDADERDRRRASRTGTAGRDVRIPVVLGDSTLARGSPERPEAATDSRPASPWKRARQLACDAAVAAGGCRLAAAPRLRRYPYRARSSRLRTLPDAVRGRASTNAIVRGSL